MGELALVFTGLPASGKTTLARAVASELELAFFDKDDILESLFDSLGCDTLSRRRELSRASDAIFQVVAGNVRQAALVSFWESPGANPGSGSPVDWITDSFEDVVEIHCHCDPAIAAKRFHLRDRHPGHCDRLRDVSETVQGFELLAEKGPLGIGHLIEVNTSENVNLNAVISELRSM